MQCMQRKEAHIIGLVSTAMQIQKKKKTIGLRQESHG